LPQSPYFSTSTQAPIDLLTDIIWTIALGRQIQLSMLPADRDALLAEIQSHGFVEITTREGDSNKVQPMASLLGTEGQTLILWNKKLAPNLQRKLIENATTVYYRVDESALPVLEFSTSVLTVPHLWAVWGKVGGVREMV
jgi:hypothetical protein